MSAAAALIVLRADPGVSVTELGRRVGLTQSAAVRMVAGLEREALVERRRTVRSVHAGEAIPVRRRKIHGPAGGP
ncbi:MarR family transcriptional regulator [Streptomyces malaysiensis]|uniref:MarR family transcriptional regulator n=1 Tax=Streptomyces malaysiensis TaxID=92644 RepID=UPI0009A07709|nr:helix-turn-helix domain-containing protein [Streptomyces sp. SPMA113]